MSSFLERLLESFRQEFKTLLDLDSEKELNLEKKIDGEFADIFFGTDIINDEVVVYYNPNKLLELKYLLSEVTNTHIQTTAIYFAHHEFNHYNSKFHDINSISFEKPQSDEIDLRLKNSYEMSFFNYGDLQYQFIEYFIDISLQDQIKNKENLFIHYNLDKLNNNINNLLTDYLENYSIVDIRDDSIRKYVYKQLKDSKTLNNIVHYIIRLYGLNQGKELKEIMTKNRLSSLLEVLDYVILTLNELNETNLGIVTVKNAFIGIVTTLEEIDYIKLLYE